MHPHFKKLVNAHVMILRRNKCTVFVVILRKGPYLELIRCHPHDSGHFWNRIFCYSDSCGRGHKPLEEWFLKRCGSSGQIHWFHVDGRSLCVKKEAVSKTSRFLWTWSDTICFQQPVCKESMVFLPIIISSWNGSLHSSVQPFLLLSQATAPTNPTARTTSRHCCCRSKVAKCLGLSCLLFVILTSAPNTIRARTISGSPT